MANLSTVVRKLHFRGNLLCSGRILNRDLLIPKGTNLVQIMAKIYFSDSCELTGPRTFTRTQVGVVRLI